MHCHAYFICWTCTCLYQCSHSSSYVQTVQSVLMFVMFVKLIKTINFIFKFVQYPQFSTDYGPCRLLSKLVSLNLNFKATKLGILKSMIVGHSIHSNRTVFWNIPWSGAKTTLTLTSIKFLGITNSYTKSTLDLITNSVCCFWTFLHKIDCSIRTGWRSPKFYKIRFWDVDFSELFGMEGKNVLSSSRTWTMGHSWSAKATSSRCSLDTCKCQSNRCAGYVH